jgi:tetratricopeptide (TPR) repeat protein
VNRDNALFALMGILLGFVAAYPVFEAMSARQPSLRPPGGPGAPEAASAAAADPAAAGGGPMNEEVRRLREYVEANPADADAVRALANLNLQVNDYLRARTLYERYVELRPEDPEGVLTLANLYYETREFPRARQQYERYLELGPESPEVLTDLGVSYRNLREPQRALELFRRAQALRPGHWVSLYNEVVVLAFDLEDFAAAGEPLERLLSLQPDNPDVKSLAAEVERRRGAA